MSPGHTLQIVIQTQKCEPFQLNKQKKRKICTAFLT